MSRAHRLPAITLILIVTVPLAWLACGGGETKPPESPASESSASASSEAPASSDSPAASGSAASDTSSASSPSAETTAASAPPPPSLESTDCGKCIDKACSKQAAACSKNSDCSTMLESIHSCSSGAAGCLDSATAPSAAKPKKLAAAFEGCAKKATTSKACKAKCQ